jgi:hypothetical protein
MEHDQPPTPVPPAQVIDYALPAAFSTEVAWRSGMHLVVADKANISSRCVKCNQPARVVFNRRARWQSPWWLAAILLPIFIGPLTNGWAATVAFLAALILSENLTSTINFQFGICSYHSRLRRRRMMFLLLLLSPIPACIALAIIRTNHPTFLSSIFDLERRSNSFDATAVLVSIASCISAFAWKLAAIDLLHTTRINGKRGWFRGAGIEFLNSLPPL